jgi:hypothetical protein
MTRAWVSLVQLAGSGRRVEQDVGVMNYRGDARAKLDPSDILTACNRQRYHERAVLVLGVGPNGIRLDGRDDEIR